MRDTNERLKRLENSLHSPNDGVGRIIIVWTRKEDKSLVQLEDGEEMTREELRRLYPNAFVIEVAGGEI